MRRIKREGIYVYITQIINMKIQIYKYINIRITGDYIGYTYINIYMLYNIYIIIIFMLCDVDLNVVIYKKTEEARHSYEYARCM